MQYLYLTTLDALMQKTSSPLERAVLMTRRSVVAFYLPFDVFIAIELFHTGHSVRAGPDHQIDEATAE